MNSMFLPYYKINYQRGFSGKSIYHLMFPLTKKTFFISSEEQLINCNSISDKFNPYRDLQYGGITLGIGNLNYWFPIDSLLGRLLDKIL